MTMCGICWLDGRSLTDEIDDLRQRVKEAEAEALADRDRLGTEPRQFPAARTGGSMKAKLLWSALGGIALGTLAHLLKMSHAELLLLVTGVVLVAQGA